MLGIVHSQPWAVGQPLCTAREEVVCWAKAGTPCKLGSFALPRGSAQCPALPTAAQPRPRAHLSSPKQASAAPLSRQCARLPSRMAARSAGCSTCRAQPSAHHAGLRGGVSARQRSLRHPSSASKPLALIAGLHAQSLGRTTQQSPHPSSCRPARIACCLPRRLPLPARGHSPTWPTTGPPPWRRPPRTAL